MRLASSTGGWTGCPPAVDGGAASVVVCFSRAPTDGASPEATTDLTTEGIRYFTWETRMRILYHHRTRGKAVEGIHIREVVLALRELGNSVYVASPSGIDPLAPPSEDEGKANGVWGWVSKHLPQIGFETLELLYNLAGYRRIRQELKRNNIEAIYERYAFFTWAGTYLAKKNGIPIILEVNEVSGIERVRGQVLVGLAKSIEKKMFDAADGIVVVSEFLKKHISEDMDIDADKIHVVPNAVDPRKFNPDVDGDAIRKQLDLENEIVVGFVGSFVSWSNLESLIHVFGEVYRDAQRGHLMLVGDGPMRDAMERTVEEEGLTGKVTFTGNVKHEDVPKFVAAMDICIIPRSNEYRSPVKLYEYMALAKPVVAPRLEPIESVIKHGENGVLFEQDNEHSLKQAVMSLIEKEEKREMLASAACKSVLEKYTWRVNAERVIRIYDAVLAKSSR
jgi:glycosyltransferase involved in cell wall biosynthesis